MKLIRFTNKGIYCPQGKFYIDPWRPVDLAIITHGHADHARWGMKKYLCHHFTKPILHSRISEDIEVQSVEYGEKIMINGVQVSLHPAGHIIGSAQIRLEYKGYVSVISGDYKVQNDGLSTPFELVKCHEFVTESTFGLPIYNWLEIEDLNKKLQNWVLRNKENQKTSVFIGYSLGKAQRIMKAVEGLGKYLAAASGIFMVMVCGGGILPALQGWVADIAGYMPSYWVIVAGLAYLLFYALIGSKNVNKDIAV